MTKSRSKFLLVLSVGAAALALGVAVPQAQEVGILGTGDAVVTGFSGVIEPQEEPPEGQEVLDETFINTEGVSARVTPLGAPGFLWDARVWQGSSYKDILAKEVGQVFGVALDDKRFPNIYVTATSAYGLHIVEPDKDNDLRPERLKSGKKTAEWMAGQWGAVDDKDIQGEVGGPGSIWKIDGKTGEVSLFANVKFEGALNGGAGLGNITYDRAHKALFVSDLSTGMIHRFGLDGQEIEIYDPGTIGMKEAGQGDKMTVYDPKGQLDITSSDFDSEDPETWGYADADRRVWGLTVYKNRLYFAFVGKSQIWSVGLDEKTGVVLADPRWELDVPKKPKNLPVTDMLFTSQGAMVLAQRGEIKSTYDYANFADTGKARIYRYWLESPEDDPNTPSRWIADPEEYPVGFEPEHRATDGGLALNHGYTRDGYIDPNVCEASIWTTADNLRRNEELAEPLLKGGPQVIDGLQGIPTGPVKQYEPEKNNTPPWVSYMLDLEPANTDQSLETDDPLQWSDITTQGWMGDVAILRGCNGAIADGGFGGDGSGGESGGNWGWPTEYPYYTNTTWNPPYNPPPPPPFCIIGVNCPPPPPSNACAKSTGKFVCDETTGTYTYVVDIGSGGAGFNPDSIKFTKMAPGHTFTSGNMTSFVMPGSQYQLTGGVSGQTMGADLCLFNSNEMKSGKPFACCKVKFDVPAPLKACVKK